MKRGDLQVARVNPRALSKHAQKLLRNNIKTTGLLGPAIVWNEELGELLSGHQRLAQLDALERGKDYELDVTVVRMDRAKHDAMLVFLNNPASQGEFDWAKLGDMFADAPAVASQAGFDAVDLAAIFPDDARFGALYEPDAPPPQVARDAAELEEMRRIRKEARKRARERDAFDYYVVVVAQSGEALQKLLDQLGYGPDERYVSCERLLDALRVEDA